MGCPDIYDLQITDVAGESHGLVADWSKGGAGLKVEKSTDLRSSKVSTKGDYGVRDADDFFRIVQSDWSEGSGQTTYDREADSENAFWTSRNIDTNKVGSFTIGPPALANADANTLPPIIAALKDGSGNPYVFRASNAAPGVLYSLTNSGTWSSVTGTTPAGGVTSLATDGQYVYATSSGGAVYYGATTGWLQLGTNTLVTNLAFTSGTLYGTKGAATTAAQIGYFVGTPPVGAFTALSPDVTRNINAAGVTFGLVASGNVVYWGVTNGMVTKLYKAMYGGGAVNDLLQEVAIFPHGFVGASLYAYLGTVYVGGHFDASTPTKGIGVIYAVVGDSPALLTDVGSDKAADNRVLAINAYERNLYFVSNSAVWRWDLVHGGYSHWTGPISSSVVALGGPTWTKTWTMAAVPAAPATVVNTSTTVTYDGVLTTVQDDDLDNYQITEAVSFVNATGETVEVDMPANGLAHSGQWVGESGGFEFGIIDNVKDVRVKLWIGDNMLMYGEMRSGQDKVIATFGHINPYVAHTFRLTLKVTAAVFSCDNYVHATAVASVAASGAARAWTRMVGGPRGTTTVKVSEARWWIGGIYDPNAFTPFASGVGLACARDAVWAAGSGYGVVKSTPGSYPTTVTTGDPTPNLVSSTSTGGMPTVDKYFKAIHVQLDKPLAETTIKVSGTIDGSGYTGILDSGFDEDTDLLMKFAVDRVGRSISYTITLATTDSLLAPEVSEVAVLFTPIPKTPKTYTYFIRCWDSVESRVSGQLWDEDAETVADWLEELVNTVVTVERPGRTSFKGTVDGLEYLEAPPSIRAAGREGLYSMTVRSLA